MGSTNISTYFLSLLSILSKQKLHTLIYSFITVPFFESMLHHDTASIIKHDIFKDEPIFMTIA